MKKTKNDKDAINQSEILTSSLKLLCPIVQEMASARAKLENLKKQVDKFEIEQDLLKLKLGEVDIQKQLKF